MRAFEMQKKVMENFFNNDVYWKKAEIQIFIKSKTKKNCLKLLHVFFAHRKNFITSFLVIVACYIPANVTKYTWHEKSLVLLSKFGEFQFFPMHACYNVQILGKSRRSRNFPNYTFWYRYISIFGWFLYISSFTNFTRTILIYMNSYLWTIDRKVHILVIGIFDDLVDWERFGFAILGSNLFMIQNVKQKIDLKWLSFPHFFLLDFCWIFIKF